MHLGTREMAEARAKSDGRPSHMHEFTYTGPVFNTPDDPVADQVANWVTGNRDFPYEEVVNSARDWDADDPDRYLGKVQAAADRGEAIWYSNTWDGDEPGASVVARAESLSTQKMEG